MPVFLSKTTDGFLIIVFYSLLKIKIFVCVWVFCLNECITVYHMHAWGLGRPEEDSVSPGTGVRVVSSHLGAQN